MLPEYVEKLVQMSASESDIELLRGEKTILENDRVKLTRKLNRLKSEMNPERYFDPAAQLADQQERLRFSQKIAALEEEKLKVEAELDILKGEEEEAHRHLTVLKKDQDELHANQKTIAARLESARLANNETSVANFENASNTCTEDAKAKDAEVAVAEAQYQVVANKLESVSERLRNIEKTLAGYQKSRDDIDHKLENSASYVNQALQQKETTALEEVEADIAKIDARLQAIANDPVILADEIKGFIQGGKEQEALPLFEKLVNIVEAMPYATLIGTPELEVALKEATERKDAIEAKIAGSDYTNNNAYDLVQARSEYLKNRIQFFEEKANDVAAIIAQLDNDELFHTGAHVASARAKAEDLQSMVQEYENVVRNSEKESTLKRANLGRALSSKTKDYHTAQDIYHAFVKEQRDDINIATGLETNLLTTIRVEIASLKERLASLKGVSAKKKTEKDIIAEARDKRMLEEAREEIDKIERWTHYDISPKQMLAELKTSTMSQTKTEEPILEPIIPDAMALQDSVDLEPVVMPEITLEEIPSQETEMHFEVPVTESYASSVIEEPVIAPFVEEMEPQVFEPESVSESIVPAPEVVDFETAFEPMPFDAPENIEQFEVPVVPIENVPVAEVANANEEPKQEDIPVMPFAGFGTEEEPEVLGSVEKEQTLPAFEEPKVEEPVRETHKVVLVEDIAHIRNTGAREEQPTVGTPLEEGTEYVGFTDYDAGLKVA